MMKEVVARETLLKHLIQEGYPAEALSTKWITETGMWDVVIIAPRTKQLVAIVTVKVKNNLIVTSEPARKAIKKFSGIEGGNVQFFFVSADERGSLDISQFIPDSTSFEEGDFIPLQKMPNFENLIKSSLGGARKNAQAKIELICWISAIILVIILSLEFLGCISITLEQQTLLGAIIALVLIPFASKIKIFNIEFERK